MKKLILGLLASMPFICASDIVQMPGEAALKEIFVTLDLSFFVEKSNIISLLADKEKTAAQVSKDVDDAMTVYLNKMELPRCGKRKTQVLMNMDKPRILKALLEHAPAALEELKSLGIYKPAK